MIGDRLERPAFAVIEMSDHGYDRGQVDAAMIDGAHPDRLSARGWVVGHHEVERLVEDPCWQVDCFVEEVEAAAERGAAAVMINRQPHLVEIRRGLDPSDAQRQAVLGNLFRPRETLDGQAVEMLGVG